MHISFRLDDDLANRLNELSQDTKRSKSFYIQEAIKNLIDDYDDYKDAINSINESKNDKTYSIEDISLMYGIKL